MTDGLPGFVKRFETAVSAVGFAAALSRNGRRPV